MSRMFYGATAACDCVNRTVFNLQDYYDEFYSNNVVVDTACEKNMVEQGCQTIPPLMPFEMHSFDKRIICGRRGGLAFLNVTRSDQQGNCPTGTSRCSNETSAENTICYNSTETRDAVCPITQFEFSVGKSALRNAISMPFTSSVTFSYTKDADYLPANALIVDLGPCANQFFQVNTNAFKTEIQDKAECPDKQSSPTYRRGGTGWSTTLNRVQQHNLVSSWLSTLPVYTAQNTSTASTDDVLVPWFKPTYSWKLECMEGGQTV